MDKLITFVIPSYNVEKTISKTIESIVLNNSQILNYIEILIINDGSIDNTKFIAENYMKQYPSIISIINKHNGGYGSTINTGLDLAKGKYFKIVDGDDWIKEDSLNNIVNILLSQDIDLLETNYCKHFESTEKEIIVYSGKDIPYNKVLHFTDIYKTYLFPMHSGFVKTKLLRVEREYIDEHCFYTDVEYETFLIKNIDTILYIPDVVYVYRIGLEGQSVSAKGWFNHREDHTQVIWRLIEFWMESFNNKNFKTEKRYYIYKRAVISCRGHYKMGFIFPFDQQQIFVKELLDFDKNLLLKNKKIYNSAGNITIKLLRYTRFSPIVYWFLSVTAKIYRTRKTVSNEQQ